MSSWSSFPILFEDEYIVAINKPNGIMVHPTKITEDTQFILPLLIEQVQHQLFAIHRIDRGTSGVLLFGKNKEIVRAISKQFQERQIDKMYLAITRGFAPESEIIDYPIAREPHLPKRKAVTHIKTIHTQELPVPIGPYKTARYSVVKAFPETGRRHQIRRHLSHLHYPVIGDRRHGDNKHNRYWREDLGIERMLLHAKELAFMHPVQEQLMRIVAPLDPIFEQALTKLKFPYKIWRR